MKLRPVTCIHVAAYLFSALVLALTAFSHHCAIVTGWTSVDEHTRTDFYVSEGHIVVLQIYDPVGWGGMPYYYSLEKPLGINALMIFRAEGVESVGGFLSISMGRRVVLKMARLVLSLPCHFGRSCSLQWHGCAASICLNGVGISVHDVQNYRRGAGTSDETPPRHLHSRRRVSVQWRGAGGVGDQFLPIPFVESALERNALRIDINRRPVLSVHGWGRPRK